MKAIRNPARPSRGMSKTRPPLSERVSMAELRIMAAIQY